MTDCTCSIIRKFDPVTKLLIEVDTPLCEWCKKDPARAARSRAFYAALSAESYNTRVTIAANKLKRQKNKAKYRAQAATQPKR